MLASLTLSEPARAPCSLQVVARYCVRRSPQPYADYASCNGRTPDEYTCGCGNYADRCIGREDLSICDPTAPEVPPLSQLMLPMPPCTCDAASLKQSQRFVGRMPFFAQNPTTLELNFSNATHPKVTGCSWPPPERATALGYWYSMPKHAECPPFERAARHAADSCSWARHERVHFVRGSALAAEGFNNSVSPADLPLEWVRQSTGDVERAFHRGLEERCCGC